jgi:hypothetical protein
VDILLRYRARNDRGAMQVDRRSFLCRGGKVVWDYHARD